MNWSQIVRHSLTTIGIAFVVAVGSDVVLVGSIVEKWKPIGDAEMAYQAVLTVAAICTATLAQADTFAERWPTPSAVDPVRVAQARQPNRLRRASTRLPAVAFISPRTSIGIGHASDETVSAARPSLQPPPARLLDQRLEPGEERRRVGIVQRRATTDAHQPHLDHVDSPPRNAASMFARLHIVTNGTASSVAAIRAKPATLFVRARAAQDQRLSPRASRGSRQ